MSNISEDNQLEALNDDSIAYEQAQAKAQTDDPLVAIKSMRLEQLAVCRLKAEKEVQAMRDNPPPPHTGAEY